MDYLSLGLVWNELKSEYFNPSTNYGSGPNPPYWEGFKNPEKKKKKNAEISVVCKQADCKFFNFIPFNLN